MRNLQTNIYNVGSGSGNNNPKRKPIYYPRIDLTAGNIERTSSGALENNLKNKCYFVLNGGTGKCKADTTFLRTGARTLYLEGTGSGMRGRVWEMNPIVISASTHYMSRLLAGRKYKLSCYFYIVDIGLPNVRVSFREYDATGTIIGSEKAGSYVGDVEDQWIESTLEFTSASTAVYGACIINFDNGTGSGGVGKMYVDINSMKLTLL